MPILLRGIEGIKAYAGFNLGKSSWVEINKDMINGFASATDDWDWISVDEEKAAQGPFGGTIAQSYLVLSLMIPLLSDIYLLEDIGLGLQCGINRLRFLAPVPVNSSIRLDATLKSVDAVGEGAQLVLVCVIECDATKEPALEAEIVYRFWPSSHSSIRAVRACGSG